jgi:signal transduction histidine kinase
MPETNYSSPESGSATQPHVRRRPPWQWIGLGLLLAMVIALVAWIETTTWQQMQALKTNFAETSLEGFYLGVHLREMIEGMNGTLFRFQLFGDEEERTRFQQDSEKITALIARAKPHLATDAERSVVTEIEKAYATYLSESATFLERGVRTVRKDTAPILHAQLTKMSAKLTSQADRLVQIQHAAFDRFFVSTAAALDSLQRLLAVSVLLLVLLVSAVAALRSRVAMVPLQEQLDASHVTIQRQEKLASLGELAAGVAHEIRNPLTAIKLRLFSLRKALPEGFEHNEDAFVIAEELNRLDRIVRDFLQFARPSEPDLVDVPVDRIVHDVRNLLRAELEKRRIGLRIESDDSLVLRVDRQQIQQVLINLIQNAADSIGQDGNITIRTREVGTLGAAGSSNGERAVVLEVVDTGRGIPPELERRIFDPFFSTKEGGTGLGLAIASRIVEKHGGIIDYVTQPNRGTTFRLVFPKTSIRS